MQFHEWKKGIVDVGFHFESAYTLALKSPGIGSGKFRHGAYVPRRSGGYNSYKTHPYLTKYTQWPFQHAECACILKYGIDNFSSKDSMYVLRIGKDGTIRNSRPCKMCMAMLLETRINTVYFSQEHGFGQINLDMVRNLNA